MDNDAKHAFTQKRYSTTHIHDYNTKVKKNGSIQKEFRESTKSAPSSTAVVGTNLRQTRDKFDVLNDGETHCRANTQSTIREHRSY